MEQQGNMASISLATWKEFFRNTVSVFDENDSTLSVGHDSWTVAQQVAHTAHTIEWFTDAVFTDKGWDMDFEGQIQRTAVVTSYGEAMQWFDRAMDDAIAKFGSLSEEQLMELLPDNPILGPAPKIAVVNGIGDHTAHHRGALATYARANGKVPPMPYGGME
ncbi:hypothetical protein GF324_07810 [bacterium]|nr:hypothetical protein [bacterium]